IDTVSTRLVTRYAHRPDHARSRGLLIPRSAISATATETAMTMYLPPRCRPSWKNQCLLSGKPRDAASKNGSSELSSNSVAPSKIAPTASASTGATTARIHHVVRSRRSLRVIERIPSAFVELGCDLEDCGALVGGVFKGLARRAFDAHELVARA